MSTGRAQEMQKGGYDCWVRVEVAGKRPASRAKKAREMGHPALLLGEPTEEAAFEFLRGSAEGAAVVGDRDLPELGVGSVGVDAKGMAEGNVAVDFAVD